MARKTAYESQHITLKKTKQNDKKTKQRAWQYLFENRDKAFSETALSKVLNVHRTTVKEALGKLMEDKPVIEKSKEYKVYRIDTCYRIFDKEGYEKFVIEQQKGTTVVNRITIEAEKLSNPNMWQSDKAEFIPSTVIFYPMTKNKLYFNDVRRSLGRLFNQYIIATLDGNKDGENGLYIILKNQDGIDEVKEHIMELYSKATLLKKQMINSSSMPTISSKNSKK